MARTLSHIGLAHYGRGDYPRALEYDERALKLFDELGKRGFAAMSLMDIGLIHVVLGDYPRALRSFMRSWWLAKAELGDRADATGILIHISHAYGGLGNYPRALELLERSHKLSEELGDRAGAARALQGLGLLHGSLGDDARALELLERSRQIFEKVGDREDLARTLDSLGNLHGRLGEHPRALALFERSLKILEELGDRAGVATALGKIGTVHARLGDPARALEFLDRSRQLFEELGDRAGVATALGRIGGMYEGRGDFARALDAHERAAALALEAGELETEVRSLWRASRVSLRLDRPAEAARAARAAARKMPLLFRGLREKKGTGTREPWTSLVAAGVRAGVALQDPAEAFFFLETGRATGLLESLGAHGALRAAALPEELAEKESAARAALAAAPARLDRAARGDDVQEKAAAKAGLEAARRRMLEIVAKVRRTAKARADVAYPKAAPLAEIQAALRAGDALVLYALLPDDAVALVVTPKAARIVSLGETAPIAKACAELTFARAPPTAGEKEAGNEKDAGGGKEAGGGDDAGAAVEALRRLVVAPLGLGGDVRRVLVSPHGALAYVPFVLLVGDREVAYVPSGTTYTVLLDEGGRRGEGVLALGNPDYGVPFDARERLVSRGGALTPLPASGDEARAVGDTVLTGRAATVRGLLDAVAGRPRWRAVHLACHGRVDPARPLLSALALSGGYLTTLDVFRSRIPADLVVLSACETAKGKVYRSEGVVGLVRGFMFAGAPRVIASLWKVDDQATRALMTRFYALWNPKDGAKALPAARALKEAMAFVKSHPDHPEWRRPYYWAAWQLWGLPDGA